MRRLYQIVLLGFEVLTALLIYFHFKQWWTIPLGLLAAMQLTIFIRFLIVKLPGKFNLLLGILVLCYIIYLLLYSTNVINFDNLIFFHVFKSHPVISILDFFALFLYLTMVADMDFVGKAAKYLALSAKAQENKDFINAEKHLQDLIILCNQYENKNIKLSLQYKIITYLNLTLNCTKQGETQYMKAEEYSGEGITICDKTLTIIDKKNNNPYYRNAILRLKEQLKSLYNEVTYSNKYELNPELLKPKS